MSVPAYLVIGDSLPFRAEGVKAGRAPYEPLPDATVTYALLDAQTREEVVAEAEMTVYDTELASFEAVIADADLGLYDATTNPDGLVPNREYLLRTTVDNEGVRTSRAMRLVARLDPPEQE